MSDRPDRALPAWRPFTPRGVAAFARTSWGRLLLVQAVVAMVIAVIAVGAVQSCWFSAITTAIDRLPPQSAIVAGKLDSKAESPMPLAETRFLAMAVDLDHRGIVRSPAHIQVEFGRTDVRLYSLLGHLDFPYPKGYRVFFNAEELKPWWGAWAPPMLAGVVLAVLTGLLISWTVLGCAYSLAVWLLGLYSNRDLTLGGSFRLAGAAQVPGALVMAAGIALYAWARLDLIHFLGIFLFHFLVSWVYLVWAVLTAPKIQAQLPGGQNPFQTDSAGSESGRAAHSNPFRSADPN